MAPPAHERGYPPDSVPNLEVNTLWDGLFHAATYLFTLAGLAILWRRARAGHGRWPAKLLPGSMLVGFGLFNLVEGLVNHHWLGLHHVNETVPREQWLAWDIGFWSGAPRCSPAAGGSCAGAGPRYGPIPETARGVRQARSPGRPPGRHTVRSPSRGLRLQAALRGVTSDGHP
jgi:hypothetical protein